MSTDTVLVTGSAGMVGSHLAPILQGKGRKVVATYFRPTISVDAVRALNEEVELVELDVRDSASMDRLIETHAPDAIYHLAAQSYPTVSWTLPLETMDINAGGSINLYEAIKKRRRKNPSYDPMVITACSSAAYGASLTPENVPIREDALFQPMHPYGVSKAAQDMLAFQYFVNDKIRGIRARIFNSTGPRKSNDVVSDFCSRTADIVQKGGGKLRVGNLETRRAILDVADLVNALILLETRGQSCEAYNICAENFYPVQEVVDLLRAITGRDLEVEADPALFRPSDEPVIFGDTRKLRAHTGWAPVYTLRQTVERVLRHELSIRGLSL